MRVNYEDSKYCISCQSKKSIILKNCDICHQRLRTITRQKHGNGFLTNVLLSGYVFGFAFYVALIMMLVNK